MVNRQFNSIKDIATDFFLDEGTDTLLYSIIPELGRNFAVNPALIDVDNDGIPDYIDFILPLGTGSIVEQSTGLFGPHFYSITGSANSDYFGTQANSIILEDTTLTASIWIKSTVVDDPGLFQIEVVGNVVGDTLQPLTFQSPVHTTTNVWQQFTFTFDPEQQIENPAVRIRFFEKPLLAASQIDVAGFQLEERPYATTFIHGFSGEGYSWEGISYRSTSRRDESVICGGRTINLKDLGVRLESVIGLGIPSDFDFNTQQRAFALGSVFKCRSIESREIEINLRLYACDIKDLITKRNNIGHSIFSIDEPRCFIWQPRVCDATCPCVRFTAVLEDGFEFNYESHYGEEISLTFQSFDVEIVDCFSTCIDINLTETFQHSIIAGEDELGNAVSLDIPGGSPSIQLTQIFDAVISDYDGNLYVAGKTDVAPYTNNSIILCYDGRSWQAIARTEFFYEDINTLYAYGKYLFVGMGQNNLTDSLLPAGAFTGTSGDVAAALDLETQTILPDTTLDVDITDVLDRDGNTVNPSVNAFVGRGNVVYVGGNFIGHEGGNSPDLFQFDLQLLASSPAPGFLDRENVRGGVLDLLYVREQDTIWVGGDYHDNTITIAGNHRILSGIQFRPGVINIISPTAEDGEIDYPLNNLVPGIVTSLAYYGNRIIAGGLFNNTYTNFINGGTQTIENLLVLGDPSEIIQSFSNGLAIREFTTDSLPTINNMTVCDNVLYIAGKITEVGYINDTGFYQTSFSTCGQAEIYTTHDGIDSRWNRPETQYNTTGGTDVCNTQKIICGNNKLELRRIYFNATEIVTGGTTFNSMVSVPTIHTLCSNLLAVRPDFTLIGPMTVYFIGNNVTNERIVFDSYRIVDDEILTIRNSVSPIEVYSNLYGNISYELENTSTPVNLIPGENSIVISVDDTTLDDNSNGYFCYNRQAIAAEHLQVNCPDID